MGIKDLLLEIPFNFLYYFDIKKAAFKVSKGRGSEKDGVGFSYYSVLSIGASEGYIDQEKAHLIIIKGRRKEASRLVKMVQEGGVSAQDPEVVELKKRGFILDDGYELTLRNRK